MRQSHERPAITSEALVDMLNDHADKTAEENTSNSQYAETVRLRAQQAQRVIDDRSGAVRSVIATWERHAQPIIEAVFGMSLEGQQVGDLSEYSLTGFYGIYGRVRIVSIDEIWGPALALDLIAEDSLPTPQ
ncbi:MAG: hypothetical protein ACHQT9_01215 [Candidatus Saccharimonadales bacterium]